MPAGASPPPRFAGVERLYSVPGREARPDADAAAAVAGPAPEGTGERIARRFFDLCENPRTRQRMMKLLGRSANSAVGGRLLVAFLSRLVFGPVLRSRRVDRAAAKFELLAAQLGGIAVLRYVTRMEPVASMPLDDLVGMVAPSLQATLDG